MGWSSCRHPGPLLGLSLRALVGTQAPSTGRSWGRQPGWGPAETCGGGVWPVLPHCGTVRGPECTWAPHTHSHTGVPTALLSGQSQVDPGSWQVWAEPDSVAPVDLELGVECQEDPAQCTSSSCPASCPGREQSPPTFGPGLGRPLSSPDGCSFLRVPSGS